MTSLESVTGRNYLSYSSMSSLLDCGTRFQLERVLRAPQGEAWWFAGGTAFHEATEELDHGLTGATPDEAWAAAWTRQLVKLKDVDPATIRAGGRASKEWPLKENGDWWGVNGYTMIRDYADYRTRSAGEGWVLPDIDGRPAIELPFEVTIGDTTVKGFIDRVFINPDGEAVIVDYKSGARTPDSTLQLGVYAIAMLEQYGMHVNLGAYYMARKGDIVEQKSLAHYSQQVVGDWFTKARLMIEQQLFIPHVSSFCSACTVRPYCPAQGGDPTLLGASLVLPNRPM